MTGLRLSRKIEKRKDLLELINSILPYEVECPVSNPVAGGELLDPDQAAEYVRQWKNRIDQMAARTRAVADRLNQVKATARDANDLAEVTVDSTGVLIDLKLSERIQRVPPDAVARAILNAAQQARVEAAKKSRDVVTEVMGPDSVAARTIAEQIEQRLQRSADEERREGIIR